MKPEQQSAIDNLRSDNLKLSNVVRDAVYSAARKSSEFISSAEDSNDLLAAIKVLETSAKMVGLSPKETQANIQINAINGFEFIEIDEEDIKQIVMEEEFEEADIEDES